MVQKVTTKKKPLKIHPKTRNKKALMLEALTKNLGIVTDASNACGVNRKSHYAWLQNDPKYKKAVEDISDITLDFVESQLHKQIQNGEVSSTIFYLKTKGKPRGYIERSEIDHTSGGEKLPPISITVAPVPENSKLPNDESQIDLSR